MSELSKYGRAEIQKTTLLPEMSFDIFEGQPTPPGFGKAEAPVHYLPDILMFDMLADTVQALLQIRVTFKPNLSMAEIAKGCHSLYKVLHDYELALGGSGLEALEPTEENGEVVFTYRAVEPSFATERLQQLLEKFEQVSEKQTTFLKFSAEVLVQQAACG